MQTDLLENSVSIGKASLADYAVVDVLVRGFASEVFETRAAWHSGQPGAREPLALIELEARRMGNIFLGRDLTFDIAPWNTENRLGMYFRVLLPEETEHYGDPGSALFMWLARQLIDAAATFERDPAAEDRVKRRLERIIVDVVARLLRQKY